MAAFVMLKNGNDIPFHMVLPDNIAVEDVVSIYADGDELVHLMSLECWLMNGTRKKNNACVSYTWHGDAARAVWLKLAEEDSQVETDAILADPDTMAAIVEAENELRG